MQREPCLPVQANNPILRLICKLEHVDLHLISFAGTPFGELPVLELDNRVKIGNTMAIARFLARQYDILPEDTIEQAQADMLVEVIQDLSDKLRPVTQAAFFIKDQERKVRLFILYYWMKCVSKYTS